MPSAVSPNPRAGSAPPDELDHLLDYDNAVDDFLRDLPMGNGDQTNTANGDEQPRDEDQEVQVKKKRAPVPKLDEHRLLSQAGIPKLRKIAKTRLKFRGKGHEFSDISRLLNTYQLWLDDLYPRAKFRDALTMVEKVGHSKRMQVMRKAWLDDTKPNRRGQSPDVEMSGAIGQREVDPDDQDEPARRDEDLFAEMVQDKEAHDIHAANDAPDDDELDALLAEDGVQSSRPQPQPHVGAKGPFTEDEPDEDDLDAMLAERESASFPAGDQNATQPASMRHDPDGDELDALMAEQSSVRPVIAQVTEPSRRSPKETRDEADFADEEEVLAGMDGMW
ncbi:Chromosome segregation in meiosis protein 3 [Fulvia fulva]|uniref:Chromosome segregation in meiosis protein n=1 Tax=Passalora fulva TaxID=5499 RepID=A0A9Q8PCX4_PASFU|nr:Chromosome segregation in meiosis protein 3 [Fulvia fulva]KAK4620837.1 hypothetical protein CLAFUR0_11469 [Fulvia fulva]UJO20117.1 Chromosome segregation in meiosis protein 3 [Fulvia fulva]